MQTHKALGYSSANVRWCTTQVRAHWRDWSAAVLTHKHAGWPVSPATFLSQARHPARTGCSKNTPMQQLAAESRGRGFARMARRYTVIIVIIIMVGDVSPRPGSCCVASLRCTLVHRLAAGSTCGRRGAADVAGRIYLCFPPRLPAWRWRGGQRCVRIKVVWCV